MADYYPLVLESGVHHNLHAPDALVVDILKLGLSLGAVTFGDLDGRVAQDVTHFSWDTVNSTLLLGGATAAAASNLVVSTTKTLSNPAAGSVWDGLKLEASQLSVAMNIANVTITELSSSRFLQPTIEAIGGPGLLTVTDAYVVRIMDAPKIGHTGTITNAWSLGVTGPVKLMSMLYIAPAAVTSGVFTGFTKVGAAHTGLTSGTEVPDANFDLSATKTWATGAIATQRDFLVQARTYAFAAASTVTTGATVAITGAPVAGAFATITNPLALWVQSGNAAIGNGYPTTLSLGGPSVAGHGVIQATSSGQLTFNNAGWPAVLINGRIGLSIVPAANSRLHLQASSSLVAAAGAAWNGVNFADSTLTLTGATTPITTLNYVTMAGPTVTAASAVVTTDFYTCRIAKAVFAGAGPASATRQWALGLDDSLQVNSGNIVLGTGMAAGTNANRVLALQNGATAPSASVDLAHLYSADHNAVAGAAALALYQEAATVTCADQTVNRAVLMTVNGTPLWVMARSAAPV
jgi:hypothetical protein